MTYTPEQIVTPAAGHCRHGLPFMVVSVDDIPPLAPMPSEIGFPGHPGHAGYTIVRARSMTHPQTIGTLHMTPDGWAPFSLSDYRSPARQVHHGDAGW